jgi:hypothetical protein
MRKPKQTEAEIMGEVVAASPVPRRVHVFGDERKANPEEKPTMKVKMNKALVIYVDGIHPSEFKEGDVVDFPAIIAESLLSDNRASRIETETKALAGAPENKMRKGPKANKVKE